MKRSILAAGAAALLVGVLALSLTTCGTQGSQDAISEALELDVTAG